MTEKQIELDTANRPAGAWIIRDDGTMIPDMSDSAMRTRYGGVDKKPEIKTEIKKEERNELQPGAHPGKDRR